MSDDILIYESIHLTKTETKAVNRTWIERLFSWPWQPLKRTKTVTIQFPDPNIYCIGENKFVCHPVTARQLEGISIIKDHLATYPPTITSTAQ